MADQTLAQIVRAKYPGVYDDLSDQELEAKVIAKYPQYGDLPRTPAKATTPSTGTVFGKFSPQLEQALQGQKISTDDPSMAIPAGAIAKGAGALAGAVRNPRATASTIADLIQTAKGSPLQVLGNLLKKYGAGQWEDFTAASGPGGTAEARAAAERAVRAPTPPSTPPDVGPRPGSQYVKGISSERLVPPISQFYKDLLPQGENLETLAQEALNGPAAAPAGTAPAAPVPTAAAAPSPVAPLAQTSTAFTGGPKVIPAGNFPTSAPTAPAGPVSSAGRTQEIQQAMKDLYSKYGRGEVSKIVNPNAAEVATGDAVRATKTGSRMPDNAQAALLRDLQGGRDQAPSVQRAIKQLLKDYQRNQGPAPTPVAQKLYQVLKKMGYLPDA